MASMEKDMRVRAGSIAQLERAKAPHGHTTDGTAMSSAAAAAIR
jgi:hypothetical protein